MIHTIVAFAQHGLMDCWTAQIVVSCLEYTQIRPQLLGNI